MVKLLQVTIRLYHKIPVSDSTRQSHCHWLHQHVKHVTTARTASTPVNATSQRHAVLLTAHNKPIFSQLCSSVRCEFVSLFVCYAETVMLLWCLQHHTKTGGVGENHDSRWISAFRIDDLLHCVKQLTVVSALVYNSYSAHLFMAYAATHQWMCQREENTE